MTPHAWVFGIMAFFGLKAAGWLPFQNEIQQALTYAIPFIPYFILAWILAGPVTGAVGAVTNWVDRLIHFVASLIYAIVFTALVVPTMLADSFLLGPIAMWAWKYQTIQILSIVVNGFMYWFLTQTPTVIPKKIIVAALIVSVTFVFGGYFSQFVFNTHWLEFTAQNGTFMPDPAASITLKAGDTVHFVALGYSVQRSRTDGVVMDEMYPPEGDQTDLVHDGVNTWPRPRGEIQLLVRRPTGPATTVYVEDVTSGPAEILWWSFKDLVGGYYVSGKATVPAGTTPGRLGMEFLGITPVEGYMKMTMTVNPGKTAVAEAGKRFILRKGGKPKPDKETMHVVFNILTAIVVGFTLIGMTVNAYQSKEGVIFHVPDIVLSTAVVGVLLFGAEWFFFEGGTVKALWLKARGVSGW